MLKTFFIFICVSISGLTISAEPLHSSEARDVLCSRIVDQFDLNEDRYEDASKACPRSESSFKVVETLRDERLGITTLLKIEVELRLPGLIAFKGRSHLIRGLKVGKDGQVEATGWYISELKTVSKSDLASTKTLLDGVIETLNTGNGGGVDLSTYPANFDFKAFEAELKSIESDANLDVDDDDDACKTHLELNTVEALSSFKSIAEYSGNDILERVLNQLDGKQLIKKVYALTEEGGMSEYCNVHNYYLFTNDGLKLSITFDFTT